MEIKIRKYNSNVDDPYIYSTWTKYAWYSPSNPHIIGKKEFFDTLGKHIKSILSEGQVRVACLKDDQDIILGYIAYHNGKEEWICVKKDFHNSPIREALINSMKEEMKDG
jgi:hypothetical protein